MQISLGSVTTQPGIATSQYNFEDRIFALTPSASSPDVIANKDNVFQMCFSDPNQGLASAQYISEQNLGENVYIIWKNDDVYSTGIKDQFVAEAEELGLNIVGNSTFTTDTSNDFTVQLTDAQQKGADLVFLPMYYQPASLILTQADSMGYEPKFFGVDGMDGILTMEGFDASLAEGVMLLTPFNADATDDATVAFVTEYESLYGETPNQFAADSYDCIYALKLALETAGCTPDMTARGHQRRPDRGVPHHHPDRPHRRRRGHHLGLHRRGVQGPQGHGHRERRLRGHGLRSPLPASDKPLPSPGRAAFFGAARPGRGAVNERGDASERSRRGSGCFPVRPGKKGNQYGYYHYPELSDPWLEPGQRVRHHRPGLHHGLRHRQDAELCPRRRHHGGWVRLLLHAALDCNFAEGSVAATVVPAVAGTLLAMAVCTVLGVVIERLAYKPLRQAPSLAVLITAIGVSYFLQNAALLLWSSNPKVFTPVTGRGSLQVGALSISYVTLLTIAACIIIMVVLTAFTSRTKLGKAMRAVSEDKGAAQLMGINVNATISLTFAIGSALAAIAGVLYMSAYPTLTPTTGSMPGIKAFTAAVFGGIGSIPGAMLGGLLLGVIEIFAGAYISTQLQNAIVFAVLIVVLLVKPAGLLGKMVQEKV